ncbi:MAG: efflux RND transporter periplasmic adaptor subunit [Psychromonas sp.]|nr:efflux RND transporter periplasmic adaptor subunit [Alteromonadales bacterium]MCP5077478.1 efflux RND transporter periplasmic adaptor subunit [Psychromonas sp.]
MKRIIILLLITAVLIGLIYWKKQSNDHASISVNSVVVKERVLSDSVLASGNLRFDKQVKIRSELTGSVTDIQVKEGQFVEKGQLLLRLDKKIFTAEVQRFQAAVNGQQIQIDEAVEIGRDLKRRLKQKKILFNKNLIGRDDYFRLQSIVNISEIKIKAAKERLKQSTASLALANDKLQKTTFTAPITGVVSVLDIAKGETVTATGMNINNSSLMTISDPNTIIASLRVDEADIATIKLDQQVGIFVAGAPNSEIKGKVVDIAMSARSLGVGKGQYFRVKVELLSQVAIYPGMSCRAEIITKQSNKLLSVPITSVHQADKEYFVWLIENNRAKKQFVEIGMTTDTHQGITAGLTPEDTVITGPARTLRSINEGISIKVTGS